MQYVAIDLKGNEYRESWDRCLDRSRNFTILFVTRLDDSHVYENKVKVTILLYNSYCYHISAELHKMDQELQDMILKWATMERDLLDTLDPYG